jgi:hypothetical protein
MLVTYHIVENVPTKVIKKLLQIEEHTACDWLQFCRVVLLDFIETNTEMIGEGKVVEIDEGKFGKRKYHRGRFVKGQRVFGGVERVLAEHSWSTCMTGLLRR